MIKLMTLSTAVQSAYAISTTFSKAVAVNNTFAGTVSTIWLAKQSSAQSTSSAVSTATQTTSCLQMKNCAAHRESTLIHQLSEDDKFCAARLKDYPIVQFLSKSRASKEKRITLLVRRQKMKAKRMLVTRLKLMKCQI